MGHQARMDACQSFCGHTVCSAYMFAITQLPPSTGDIVYFLTRVILDSCVQITM